MGYGLLLSTRLGRRTAALACGSLVAVAAASPAAPADRSLTPAPKVKGNTIEGRKLFRSNCGVCHTLSIAGTHSRVGPNLGLDRLQYSTVTWMVKNGDSLMPGFKGVLKTGQIQDVAAFVSAASRL